jgi:OmcA/MtrC family decaheme c-type cytochrome
VERLAGVAEIHNMRAATDLAAGLIQINSITFPATTVKPVLDFTVYGPDCGTPGTPFAASSTCAPFDYVPVNGQPIEQFNFTVAELAAAPSLGENPYWVNYLNNNSERSCGSGVNASNVPNCAATGTQLVGTLTRLGTGHFQYTFKTDLSTVTAPGTTTPVIYDPAATTRFGIQTGNNQIYANGTLDVVPSGGTANAPTIVTTQACNQCHKRLTIHGRRILEAYCVTCHDPALTSGGQSGNMAVMIHSWHAGAQLNLAYSFAGVVATEITYPQNVANCTTCHQDPTSTTALTAWQDNPSFTACFSCHVGGNSAPPHPFAVTATTNCKTCHNSTATDKTNVAIAHGAADSVFADATAAQFQYRILSVTNTAVGQAPSVKLAVVNPTVSPATTYDLSLTTGPWSFKQAGGASRLFVDIGWQNSDFRNVGDAVAVGQPIQLDVLNAGVVNTTDFSVVVTSATTIPAGLTGSLTVAIEGHPGVPNPLSSVSTTTPVRIPVKNVTRAVAVTGSASARRTVVDVAKCNLCHENLSLHGNNRTPEPPSASLPYGSVAVCTMCHNTEATDVQRRPTTGTGIDGKTQEAIDLKTMIHGIHSAQLVIYGFGGSVNDFRDVTYPGPLNDCQSCHISPPPDQFPITYTYSGPQAGAFGTTTDAAADLVGNTDNLRTTKWAATCLSCHGSSVVFDSTADPTRTARVHDHVIVNGAGFGMTQAEIDALNQ